MGSNGDTKGPDEVPITMWQQLKHATATSGAFDATDLVVVWGGGNDVVAPYAKGPHTKEFLTGHGLTPEMVAEANRSAVAAAKSEAALVRQILAAGAKKVVVLDLIDLSFVPFAPGMSRNGLELAGRLTSTYNQTLWATMPTDPAVLAIKASTLFDQMVSDPDKYGYRETLIDACNNAGFACSPDHYVTPDAAEHYMFAGWGHFTAKTRTLIAQEVQRQIRTKWPAVGPSS
jgi:phospholipase/lecithinase/hemolysin